jgi:tetratricopeptide (TPR) repeat protein
MRYREARDTRGIARVLDARAMAIFLAGDLLRGAAELRRAADLFEDSGDLLRIVTPRSTAGHALVFAGRPVEGLALAMAALDLARQLGYPEGESFALWHCAEATAAAGQTAESATFARDALATALRIGHRGWTATGWRAVGIAAESAGDLAAALSAYRSSLAASEHLDLFASWAAARAASVLVRCGELDEAEAMISRALAVGPPLAHYEARLAAVELAAARDPASAVTLAKEALAKARAGGWNQGITRLAALAGPAVTPVTVRGENGL